MCYAYSDIYNNYKKQKTKYEKIVTKPKSKKNAIHTQFHNHNNENTQTFSINNRKLLRCQSKNRSNFSVS